MRKALSLDVGGTKIYHTIVDEGGKICGDVEKHSTPKDLNKFIELFKSIFAKYENEVDVVAIATAGAVNNENTGVISSTGNLVEEYNAINFHSMTKKNVYVENDANSAAWAEHILGASKCCPNSIMITLGTGVGGGIIVNGRLF